MDFLTDYNPVITKYYGQMNMDAVFQRMSLYRDSLALKLKTLSLKYNKLFDIYSFSDRVVTPLEIKEISLGDQINLISLGLNTDAWGVDSDENLICFEDIQEEVFYTKRRFNRINQFDPTVFSNATDEDCVNVAKINASNYGKQGKFARELGKLVLMDELPPALKSRKLMSGAPDLITIFPWIREEDRWRNPNTIRKNDTIGIVEIRAGISKFKAT